MNKQYSTIGCCGIDCGLCPRFYTQGSSACPGCGGKDFAEKHPSCGYLTCCSVKRNLEVCAQCNEFPCKRFDSEKKGYDSFVTHQMVFVNQHSIKQQGIKHFINQQQLRIDHLVWLLENFDDGRSKNFFCLACALLPLHTLHENYKSHVKTNTEFDLKMRNMLVKNSLLDAAKALNIELKLRKKQ